MFFDSKDLLKPNYSADQLRNQADIDRKLALIVSDNRIHMTALLESSNNLHNEADKLEKDKLG